jgi:hypothetical protein
MGAARSNRIRPLSLFALLAVATGCTAPATVSPPQPTAVAQILVGVMGTNQGETFLGIPAFVVPLIGLPTPEIALFRWQGNRGMVEVQIYAFDGSSTAFASETPVGTGESRFDNFTVLRFVSFTLDDLEAREL